MNALPAKFNCSFNSTFAKAGNQQIKSKAITIFICQFGVLGLTIR